MDYTFLRKYLRPTARPRPAFSFLCSNPSRANHVPVSPHATFAGSFQILHHQHIHQNPSANPFKTNTCISASKQMTYIPLAINIYNTQFSQLPRNHHLQDLGKVLGCSLISAVWHLFFYFHLTCMIGYWRGRKDSDLRNVREHVSPD